MRLRTITPPLPEELLELLEECNIKTDAELLFSATPMEIYERIAPCSITLAELISEIKRIAAINAAPVIYGDALYEREKMRHYEDTDQEYTSGLSELDDLVGGFHVPGIIEISGDRDTGKSALALQVVVRHLSARADHSALWIDTTGDLSIDRVIPILNACDPLPGVDTAATRLQLALAFDLDTIYQALEAAQAPGQSQPVKIIVIDSVTPIFRPLLSAISAQGHAMMTVFMQYLRSFAETNSALILVVNGTSAMTPNDPTTLYSTRARKPALGPSFTYLTDTTVWLSRAVIRGEDGIEGMPYHVAETLRSKVARSNTQCCFRIQNGVFCTAEDSSTEENE
ncbi:hypothetical protein NM688_g2406 [Phlebia brevispora]|uniref:Uncharacterized protein n=1 Tax=Phlebia brevispora TaxID=194682 RepID=A0ACC1T8R2_9APHY|nr:hypothetical protein NM688_g2406 [Phlebia brevispora]